MKKTLSRTHLARLASFTLVELLVVMAIIAILASILIVAASSAINAAKRARASVMENQIQTGVLNYYTEYSVYPVPSATTADTYYSTNDATDWKQLMWALCGNINPYDSSAQTPTVSNTRGIAYLSPRKSDVDSNGVFLNPIGPDLKDGPYYNIAIDGNYDGSLGGSGSAPIPVVTNPYVTTNVITAGAVLWVDCNPSSTSTNANFWIHSGF